MNMMMDDINYTEYVTFNDPESCQIGDYEIFSDSECTQSKTSKLHKNIID